jgi:hypothetical protein
VDCGKNFESQRIKEMAQKMNTELIFSSPYHHNANGIIERQFRTIRDYINATVKERTKTNWANILPEIEFTLNATVQKTINMSPAEMIFGRKIDRTRWLANKNKKVEKTMINRNEITENQETEPTKRKFEIGDKVLVKKEIRTKDQERYEGPYTITRKIHERSYEMKNEEGTKIKRNIEKIKDFKIGGM